jgi:hypothetical protein
MCPHFVFRAVTSGGRRGEPPLEHVQSRQGRLRQAEHAQAFSILGGFKHAIATPLGLKPPWSGFGWNGTMTNKTKPLKTLILERSHSWMSSFNTLKPRDCSSGQMVRFKPERAKAVNA